MRANLASADMDTQGEGTGLRDDETDVTDGKTDMVGSTADEEGGNGRAAETDRPKRERTDEEEGIAGDELSR